MSSNNAPPISRSGSVNSVASLSSVASFNSGANSNVAASEATSPSVVSTTNASGPIAGTNGSSEMGYTLPSEGASSSEAVRENNIGDLDEFMAESREGERREALTPGARKFAKSAQDNKERNSEKNKIVINLPKILNELQIKQLVVLFVTQFGSENFQD